MEHRPVTGPEMISGLVVIGVVEIIIATFGFAVLCLIGRKSLARMRHGRFVLAWMLLGWMVGGIFGWRTLCVEGHVGNDAFLAAYGRFGLLIGWAVGLLRGGVAIRLKKAKKHG